MAESLLVGDIYPCTFYRKTGLRFFLICEQDQSLKKKKKKFHLHDGDQSVKLLTSCWRHWRTYRAIRRRPSCLCSSVQPGQVVLCVEQLALQLGMALQLPVQELAC